MLHRIANARGTFTAVLLLGTGALVYQTFGLSPTSRLVPQAVLFPTLALLLAQLVLDLKRPPTPPNTQKAKRSPESPVLLWILAMPVLLYGAGLLLAVPLYLFSFLTLRSHLAWPRALLLTLLFSGLLYGLSTFVLQTRPYPGLLF